MLDATFTQTFSFDREIERIDSIFAFGRTRLGELDPRFAAEIPLER